MRILVVKTAKGVAGLALILILSLSVFALYWAVTYRMPRTQPLCLDLRRASPGSSHWKPAEGRSFLICAALANNPHGFPGHCYVVWDRQSPVSLQYAESEGFIPGSTAALIPSLYSNVSGCMADHAAIGNMRNLDYIAIRVDKDTYDRLRAVRASFVSDSTFRTGVRDCVAYVDEIAAIAGLERPSHNNLYPLDYLERLKQLNRITQPAASVAKE